MWQTTLSNKQITSGEFWTFFSVVLFAYISGATILVFKFHQVQLEGIIIKLAEDNIRLRDVSEVCIELASAKPERVEDIIKTIKSINTWNTANKELRYLQDIEEKYKLLIKEKKKEKTTP